jgi:hypothetical protein
MKDACFSNNVEGGSNHCELTIFPGSEKANTVLPTDGPSNSSPIKFSFSDYGSQVNFDTKEIRSLADLKEFILDSDGTWCPGVFELGHRKSAAWKGSQVIALDYDGGALLAEACDRFKAYSHIVAPTRSHQKSKKGLPPADRFRVVLLLESPITDSRTWAATWESAARILPGCDPACKDVSRMFYPSVEVVSLNENGKLLEPVLPNPGSRQTSDSDGPVEAPLCFPLPSGEKGQLAARTIRFIAKGAKPGFWNNSLYKAAKDMQQQGYSIEECSELLSLPTKLSGNLGTLDASDIRTIESAYRTPPRHAPRLVDDPNGTLKQLALSSYLYVDIQNSSNCILFEPLTEQRQAIARNNLKLLLGEDYGDYSRNRIVLAKFDYNPSKPSVFEDADARNVFNTHVSPAWVERFLETVGEIPERSVLPGIMEDFFRHFTGGCDDSFEYLLDWIATAIQNRNRTILTAIGEQGTGKGLTAQILKQLVGESNFVNTRDEVLKAKFNGQLKNKRLVNIDEVAIKTNEHHDRLKDLVNDFIEIERKGENAVTVRNFASYYISSNRQSAVRPEAGDRRFSIIQVTDKKIQETELRHRIETELLLNQTIAEAGAFFYHRKVLRNMDVPFRSRRYEEVIAASLTPWQEWLLEEVTKPGWPTAESLSALQDRVSTKFGTRPNREVFEEFARLYPQVLSLHRIGKIREVRYRNGGRS